MYIFNDNVDLKAKMGDELFISSWWWVLQVENVEHKSEQKEITNNHMRRMILVNACPFAKYLLNLSVLFGKGTFEYFWWG